MLRPPLCAGGAVAYLPCLHLSSHLPAELLQLARVVTRYVAVRGPGFVSGNLEWFRVTPLGDSDLETLRRRGRFFVV